MADVKSIVDASFARAKVAMLVLFAFAVVGLNTYQFAPREADPDIPLPFAQITIVLPGISPEDAERLLVRPVENELRRVEGLTQMDAFAFESSAQFTLEFEVGLDMDVVITDVREAVDLARPELPAGIEEPIITEANAQTMAPVITVVVHGEAPERTLRRTSEQLEDRLRRLPGVNDASLVGARDEMVEIIVSPETLESYGLSAAEVSAAIRSNNSLVTGGTLRFADGDYAVKIPGLIKTQSDLAAIPVRADGDDIVTLGEIATIRRTFEDATGFVRYNGTNGIGIDVFKRAESNMVALIDSIKDEARAAEETWPSTMRVAFVDDMSVHVTSVFSSLTASILLAILLVMIVVVAALGLRSALLVGIAIPASFLMGLALIGALGFTMNQLVMFSMVLAVGMLVDGAIVIVELADRRMAEGASRRAAFIEASKRMFWPITASTATTLAAFVPFLFWNAVEGYFMRWIPLTLILVLGSSLFVALIFLPIIGANFAIPKWAKHRFGIKGQTDQPQKHDLESLDPTRLPGFTGLYARMVDGLVRRPILVIAGTLVGVWMALSIYGASNVAVEQFLRVDDERIRIYVKARGNMSSTEALSVAQEVEARIADYPGIESLYIQTGPEVSRGNQDSPPIDAVALISVDLVPYQDRIHSLKIVEDFRVLTQNVPGVLLEITQPEQGPPVGRDVQVEITAPTPAQAEAAGRLLRDYLVSDTTTIDGVTIPTFIDVTDNLPLPGIEWTFVPDRSEAGRYGLSVEQIGAHLQLATDGLIVDRYRPDDAEEEIDIRLRYTEDTRRIDRLLGLKIPTEAGPVPLSNVASREPTEKLDRIVRRDGRRVVDVEANANTSVPGIMIGQDVATAHVQEWLDTGILQEQVGPGVVTRLRGAAEKQAETGAWLQGAMLASMFMIGAILLLQFNSFYHAALTLSSVVLSVIGVLLGVALSGQYISMIMTGVGIIALAGIVVNNNIVLIDTYRVLRTRGLCVHDAVVRCAAQRLRPVLLTTVTTIIGLLPMVFQVDIDFGAATIGIGNATSEWWVLLSSAIVFGLAFATLLTLIVTPVMLAAPTVMKANVLDELTRRGFLKGRTEGGPHTNQVPAE